MFAGKHSILIVNLHPLQWYLFQHSKGMLPGFYAEAVLDEHSNEKEDHAFHSHSEEVLSHHVPCQGGTEPVLTWKHRIILKIPDFICYYC